MNQRSKKIDLGKIMPSNIQPIHTGKRHVDALRCADTSSAAQD
jgi:hypothetical protein